VTYAEKATIQQQNLIIRFVRRWKINFPSTTIDVSLTGSVLWQSSNLGTKCRFMKEKNFIPKPQHCGLDGRF